MPRYIDTGLGRQNQDVGHWLDHNLVPGIRGFRCQFGYFRYSAIQAFGEIIFDTAQLGMPVHFVIGSNAGSLIAQDAQYALGIADGRDASLTIVSFANAEFHPKTIHIMRADGTATAFVGSSNLTNRGLGRNVEAGVIWESRHDDAREIRAIAEAVDRWRSLRAGDADFAAAFRIGSDADIQDLANAGIINVPQVVPRVRMARTRRNAGGTGGARELPNRPASWEPEQEGWRPAISVLIPRPVEINIGPEAPVPIPALDEPPAAAAIVMRWCKRLDRSDAQRVQGNPTGKLRLGKARFPIDKDTWFRYDFFNTPWVTRRRRGQDVDETIVRFDVRVRGQSRGQHQLSVDHGEHRIAGQANVPTVLAWGPELNREMRDTNHVGDWVVLTRDVNGRFALIIQQHRPHWAP